MTKTKTKIIAAVFAWVLSLTGYAHAANITSVDVSDANTLKVSFSGVTLEEAPTGEVKVLKDMSVTSAVKDAGNAKVVNIGLATDLVAGSSYSLISIFGAEGSMDFSLGQSLSNVEIANTDATSTIAKVVVKDSKNVSVYFKSDIAGSEFEFKILSNLGVDSLGADIDGGLLVKTTAAIESNKAYILMVVSLKNAAGVDIAVEDGIFDFTSTVAEAPTEAAIGTDAAMAPAGTGAVTEPTTPDMAATGTGVELNAAMDTGNLAKVDDSNVDAMAMSATATPDTGAETWILILGTLLINGAVYLYRRKA